ncbi:putative RNA methylase [Geobacter metallireducens RCH3]|uniref:SAM-dependent methyltransferase n=1 Tax=Geobacter metallireducens (strain ATCC 53774 / DSM 7210 / GS-15) TaxID=269799 RepID=Q39RN0_GEOMG|nr:tRNA1(Val) (adenine(37)-N6)-methyltransferase [Geobacter metallireducens]ABB33094.1 SAM-dependent methyltransferase [Geobacter metallireducens GS-15]EHP84171.1 putative RNA methylase [Geobacter metallireducens RCH3]
MKADETIDELQTYDLRIAQERHGYRFSLDPLLLCAFAAPQVGARVIDLGTGSAVIPLVLARRTVQATFVGVELQEGLATLAERNVALNGLVDRISILCDDVLGLRKRFPVSSFDVVVSNPPYRKRGTGKVSPKVGRDDARHESSATLADFLAAAKYLVNPTGRICFIYHPSRLPELFSEAHVQKLASMRLRLVHGTSDAEARMALIEFCKGRRADLKVLPPLIVRGDGLGYTPEVAEILGGDRQGDCRQSVKASG